MAKLDLNGITLDEVKRNSNNAYAANIVSGEIFRVVCRHSKKGNVVLAIEGKALNCKDFNGDNFVTDGCVLYNPPLVKMLVSACDDSDASIFVVAGEVTTTAPKTTTSDTVVSKEGLLAEKQELQGKFFSLTPTDQVAAKARIEEIEKLLKTA